MTRGKSMQLYRFNCDQYVFDFAKICILCYSNALQQSKFHINTDVDNNLSNYGKYQYLSTNVQQQNFSNPKTNMKLLEICQRISLHVLHILYETLFKM